MLEFFDVVATATTTVAETKGSGGLDFVKIIVEAHLLVQIVMGVLLIGSLLSWTMIFSKSRALKLANREADAFEQRFWSGSDLGAIYKQVASQRHRVTGMESIFEAGFKEFARLRKQSNARPMAVVEGSHRAMRVALARELEDLETSLSFLATVGSTSPYIGLLGTVIGIMDAMEALGSATTSEATIRVVAPKMSHALFVTGLGLVAAIPAVMAYNRFSSDAERLTNRYTTFVEEFATILQRHAHE